MEAYLDTKMCTNKKCANPNKKEDGAISLIYFGTKDRGLKYKGWCKHCERIKNVLWYEKNKEKVSASRQRAKKRLEDRGPITEPKVVLFEKKCKTPNCNNPLIRKNGMLPISEFLFRGDSGNYRGECKRCTKIRLTRWTKDNPEKILANKRRAIESGANKERCSNYYYSHHEERKLKSREANRLRDPESERIRKKESYLKHKNATWARNAERLKTDVQYRLAKNLRGRFGVALKQHLLGKRVSSVKNLGCSLDYCVKYIESLWLPGMSWDNYGKGLGKWNIDHIIALLRKDHNLSDLEVQKRLVHYTNLQPLWHVDNIKKGNRSPVK